MNSGCWLWYNVMAVMFTRTHVNSNVVTFQHYVPVRTNKQFRSLKEVYDFVMHGKLPIRNLKGKRVSLATVLWNMIL